MPKVKIRLFPLAWGIAAYVFLIIVTRYRNGYPLLTSLGNLAFTMTLFLVVITAIDSVARLELWEKCKGFLLRFKFFSKRVKKTDEAARTTYAQPDDPQDGLLAIKKETVVATRKAGMSFEKRIYAAIYILVFLGIAVWRVIGILKVKPWAYALQYRGSIVDAVLLLIFPFAAVFYLKMRNEGASAADSITRDILMLFSYTSFVYAALIAASVVLKLNLLIALPWVYYAVSLYLIAALALNIALSMLKGDLLSFDYTLFPKMTRTESPEVSWKVSLKSLYTIRYTLAILPALALALGLAVWLSTTLFVAQPHQQAAVYRFGKLERSSIKDAGLHVKLPWPIDKAAIYDVRRASSMQIGYESTGSGNFIWGQAHDGGEHMLLLGNGNEIVAANLKVVYVIADLYAYITTSANPEQVLSAAAYNALMSRTVDTTLDSFLSVDRNSLAESMLHELSQFCASENLGFSVIQVIIESIHPPVDLANVYQSVVSASVDKTTAITRAHSYAAAKVIEAARLSKTAIDGARAMQHSRVSDAQKETVIFYAATEASRIAGGSYELAKQLEVYEKIIKNNKIYVFSPGVERNLSKFVIGKMNTVNLSNVAEGEGQ